MLKRSHEDRSARDARSRQLSEELVPDWGSEAFWQVEEMARSHEALLNDKPHLDDVESSWRDTASILARTSEELQDFLQVSRVHTLRESLDQSMLEWNVQHYVDRFSGLLADLEAYSGATFTPEG